MQINILKALRNLLIKKLVAFCLTQCFPNLVRLWVPFFTYLFDFLREEFHCIKCVLENLALATLNCCSSVSYVHPVFPPFLNTFQGKAYAPSILFPDLPRQMSPRPNSHCILCVSDTWHCSFSIQ